MIRIIFLSALLLGAAVPAVAAPLDDTQARRARNWDVLLSQYPSGSRARGEQGMVGFKATLDREGFATACEVTSSSGYPRLDNETCRLILDRATFKGVRDENGRKVNAVFEGTVNWKLPNVAANAAPPVKLAKADAPDERICRRTPKTGSLVSVERTCLTRAQWDRYEANIREGFEPLQGIRGSTHGQ